MTVQILSADIVCDKCERGIPVPRFKPMSQIRAWAKTQGWDSSTGKDYCPACAAQRAAKHPSST